MRIRSVLPLLTIAVALSACGKEDSQWSVLAGRVTKVTDGDTIEVELQSGRSTIQLASIDAPERGQPYGQTATVALSELVAGGEVELQVIAQDRHERLVAVVYAGGVNVNERMVRNGHAWAYRQHLKSADYCAWEAEARDRGKGLWRLPLAQRVAPWEWRAIEHGRSSVVNDYSNDTVEDCIARALTASTREVSQKKPFSRASDFLAVQMIHCPPHP